MKQKIIAIIGPTACGKSDLALKLAQDFNGEIVSADSRQFYRGMDIGTNKPTKEEQAIVPHHLIDIANPDETVTLFDYQRKAFDVIDDILQRGKLPIIIGGTGLYVSAVIENYSLTQGAIDSELREALNNRELDSLVIDLKKLDPETTVDLKNKRRVTRAIERLMASPDEVPEIKEPKYEVLILEPAFVRQDLYSKIDQRVEKMFEAGLTEEVAALVQQYGWNVPSMSGIGYSEFRPYLAPGKVNLEEVEKGEVMAKIKQDTRNYAKRQLTWFRRYLSRIKLANIYEETNKMVSDFLLG